MSDRRMLHNAEQDVIQAACRIVESSENPKRYEVVDYFEDGSELIRAVHLLRKLEEAAGLRRAATDEEDLKKADVPDDCLFVVREGQERGKGRYLHMSSHETYVRWTKQKGDRFVYGCHDEAADDAALHGGRVVRLVPRS